MGAHIRRLLLLPITNKRAIIHCECVNVPVVPHSGTSSPSCSGVLSAAVSRVSDKLVQRATKTWTDWERQRNGWRALITRYGNAALNRISYEEWTLKAIPSHHDHLTSNYDPPSTKSIVPVYYPPGKMTAHDAARFLKHASQARQLHHRTYFYACLIGIPVSIPFGLVPIVPNIPFFYLVYRAWSHWKALAGSRTLEQLCRSDALTYIASSRLDQVYREDTSNSRFSTENDTSKEVLLCNESVAKLAAKLFDSPTIQLELERALHQVKPLISPIKLS